MYPGSLGIYLHIPYCSALCHYCDFAKTARWDTSHTSAYFAQLLQHLDAWCKDLVPSPFKEISTFNLGGGTPSLFAEEYRDILTRLGPYFSPGAELSIEANPADIRPETLKIWRDLGFNRLSLGVQTFNPKGLALLKRDHDGPGARRGIEQSLGLFSNLNVDLIYNWPGQSQEEFYTDLRELIDFGVPHLSLYDLCYPAKTPLGRQMQRGKIQLPPEESQEAFYHFACQELAAAGYTHDEVSNWSLPNFSCQHNWRYWQGDYYLGVGAGAHGFLPTAAHSLGLRYSYGPSDRTFSRLPPLEGSPLSLTSDKARRAGISIESRSLQDWLLEYVGSATRCRLGLDLERIETVSGFGFRPTPVVRAALAEGTLLHEGRHLRLQPREWIRETAWCGLLLECFYSLT